MFKSKISTKSEDGKYVQTTLPLLKNVFQSNYDAPITKEIYENGVSKFVGQ